MIGVVALLAITGLTILTADPAAAPPNQPNPAANLDQCQNGTVGPPIVLAPCLNGTYNSTAYSNWVNGNVNGSKAHWREGEFLTYRAKVSGMSAGTHNLQFKFDTVHNNKHAVDYLSSYDTTETTANSPTTFHFNRNNPCADLLGTGAGSGCTVPGTPPTPAAAGTIPAATVQTNCGGSTGTFIGTQAPGVVSLFAPTAAQANANMTVTYLNQQFSTGGGSCATSVNVAFTLNGTPPASGWTVVMAWGGHIASQGDWGSGNSATAISGSPFHMALLKLDSANLGSQDRALSTSAIVNSPTIATLLNGQSANLSVPVGSSVFDTATLSGATANAGGTVTYRVFSNQACTTLVTAAGTVNVANGVVPNSSSVTFNTAGTFYWQASYSGDSLNQPATSACTAETLVVDPRQPTITTLLSVGNNGTASIGQAVTDSATLTDATANAGGSVTYTVYDNDQCTGTAVGDGGTKTVANGIVPNSDPVSFDTAGTYYWKAAYSGDANNLSAVSACGDEVVVVEPNSPSIVTTLSITNGGSTSIGTPVHDTAVLNDATADAGGTVTYTVYDNDQCTGTPVGDGGTKTVANGVVPDSDSVTFDTAGDYFWQAVYSGDNNNDPATSACTEESMTVEPNSPSIVTTLSITNGGSTSIGTPVHDTAVLNDATADAGGTVTYTVYDNDQCTGTPVGDGGTKTVANGVVPDSDSVTFDTAGDYFWQAVYSGDNNNLGATSACTEESMTVSPNGPSIATTLSVGNGSTVAIGTSVYDTAELTSQTADASGTVTYTVYDNDQCTGTPVGTGGTKDVVDGVVGDSDAVTFNDAGTFYWQAVYSGDANNLGATSACTDETLFVDKNDPEISTAQKLTPNDSATLSGLAAPAGGTVTFTLYGPDDAGCAANAILTEQVTVNGNGTYSTTNTTVHVTAPGTYRWQVIYSGDANNNGTTSECGVESFSFDNDTTQ